MKYLRFLPRFRRQLTSKAGVMLALACAIVMAQGGTAHAIFLTWSQEAQKNDTAFYDPNACAAATTPNDTSNNNTGVTYKAIGNIPISGMQVGASTYGGGWNDQQRQWQPSNKIQGGGTDDSGMGADGKPLPGRTVFSELMDKSGKKGVLGDLPMGTKIEISYGGKTIIAQKADKGAHNDDVQGKPRAVDLWWETAKLLDYSIGLDLITIHAVDPSTPVTPLNGTPGATGDPNVGQSCACNTSDNTLLSGNSNEEKAFNYFVGKGLTAIQSAAIVGNMMQESHVNPKATNPSSGAHGIAQWLGGRLTKLKEFASQHGKPVDDLALQLDYLWWEVSQGPEQASLKALRQETNLSSAVTTWEVKFERAGTGEANIAARIAFAQKLLGSSHSGGNPDGSVTDSCTAGDVQCNNPSAAPSGLSPTRTAIVCIAKQELALWKSKPGYPDTSFAQTGYKKYTQGATEEWCADFVSWVYHSAKYPLKPEPNWRYSYVPNTPSLAKGGKFHWHDASSGYQPKPGDLATHRGFNHVNIYITTSGKTKEFIGGDQGHGPYPGGSIVSTEYGSGSDVDGYLSPD